MRKLLEICGECCGLGNTQYYVKTGENNDGSITLTAQTATCKSCNGTGQIIKGVLFNEDEAKKICEICGIEWEE